MIIVFLLVVGWMGQCRAKYGDPNRPYEGPPAAAPASKPTASATILVTEPEENGGVL
jgi:hypothetical protein